MMMNKGEITKIKIIETAIVLFYKKGLSEVTFSQIAAEAELTQPALYKYFENKVVLLSDCCLHSANKGRDYIASKIKPMDLPLEQIKSYVMANLSWFHRNRPEAYALLSMFYFAHSSHSMNEIKNKIEQAGLDNIAVLIRQSYGVKEYDIEIIKHQARLIHSMLVGEIFKTFYNQPLMPIKKRIEIFENQVEQILK
jgi:AcrR family transcriptional regulator